LFCAEPLKLELVSAERIWNEAPHNAFTSLVRFKDRWFCSFREGKAHVSPDGAMRILTSADGKTWESAALLNSETADLRDPKLCVSPQGQLIVSAVAALHKPVGYTHRSMLWRSDDGRTWSEPLEIGDPNYWLWRINWRGNEAFSVGYDCAKLADTRLFRSTDGQRFEQWVVPFVSGGAPNEASLVFRRDDSCVCLLRRDGKPVGLVGTAKPPYKEWEWKELSKYVGGPHMISFPGEPADRLVAAVRLIDGKHRTALCAIDADTGKVTELLTLPSGGDCSYPGIVWHDNQLWVSYYSSHEGKTSIYLARAKVVDK
jgi:hypothetical protein